MKRKGETNLRRSLLPGKEIAKHFPNRRNWKSRRRRIQSDDPIDVYSPPTSASILRSVLNRSQRFYLFFVSCCSHRSSFSLVRMDLGFCRTKLKIEILYITHEAIPGVERRTRLKRVVIVFVSLQVEKKRKEMRQVEIEFVDPFLIADQNRENVKKEKDNSEQIASHSDDVRFVFIVDRSLISIFSTCHETSTRCKNFIVNPYRNQPC